MNFQIEATELNKLADWIENNDKELIAEGHDLYTGACGGRYTYSFTPTSLGLVITVYDQLSKKTIDLTDYDFW